MRMDPERLQQIQRVEQDAEMLALYHIDLLAQVEQQLRAVHHTMRHIEKLRGVRHRVGPELSNGQRQSTLTHLSDGIEALDAQLNVQHNCCADMQNLIGEMRVILTNLRRRVSDAPSTDTSRPNAES